jgi:hypothetical protein
MEEWQCDDGGVVSSVVLVEMLEMADESECEGECEGDVGGDGGVV